MTNLASTWSKRKRYQEAKKLEVTEIRKKMVLGGKHPFYFLTKFVNFGGEGGGGQFYHSYGIKEN
jgi:hypothetical protein